ncbi:MAG TPA: ATP-binding protein [Puia sp.]|nr:ATP-binding protein [Puia sp.]
MKNFLHFSKNASVLPDEAHTQLFKVLFDFLIERISVPGNTEQLIQLGYKSVGKGVEEVFHTYLLFEKYLTSFEQSVHYTRKSLRESVRQRFPALLREPIFHILFISETEQKNTLATQFLLSFLKNGADKFGRAGDGYFEKKLKELALLEERKQEPDVFRRLQSLSFEAFQFAGKNFGTALAGKIFERTYEVFSVRYKELEFFPHLLTLIPKDIVGREHLGIFSQAQIEQVFLEKLAESEQLNIELDQKIKENEETQRLLRKNEIMLSSVISSAMDAIVIINREGGIIRWNKAATDIFGHTEEEVKGKILMEIIIPTSHRQSYMEGFHRFLSGGNSNILNRRLELTGMRKSGAEFPIELTVTAIRHESEFYFNGFIRDISIRKQREEELVQMKEKAEQAAKAKSQFLSVMSHELRTPLNAVIGITHLLLQGNPREDQQEDLRTLQFSGESLLNIINDILDFTKLDSGKIELSAIDFNLRDLVQSLYQSFSYRAKEKHIVFDVEYDEKMPFMVKGDSFRLSQVLNNLISNAVKFTQEGSVKLKVEMQQSGTESFITKFSVIDTGIGIPAEKKEKIFEQFTQADSNTTRLYGGTGLGLSISSKLIELMDSTILIDSIPGQGSDFHFSITLQKADVSESGMQVEAAAEKSNDLFRNKRILLAEDNPFNANIARRFITGWGAGMDVVLDGQQALEFALRKKYDLILMDVQMPVLDGFACTRAIRKYLPDVPIIAVTASPKNEIISEMIACGMNDLVSKPFKPNELRNKMLEFL